MKKTVIGLVLLLFIGACIYLGYAWRSQYIGANFACEYRPYSQVEKGMSAEKVVSLLGQPHQKIVKDAVGEDRFGQGELELRIKSGWLYELPGWNGGLEIYFDTQEHVVGKNCGSG